MYCFQWLIPVLLIPKPINPAFLYNHAMFMVLYLTGFFLERKPCTICSFLFLLAVIVICQNCYGNCIFWSCEETLCECDGTNCLDDSSTTTSWLGFETESENVSTNCHQILAWISWLIILMTLLAFSIEKQYKPVYF